MNRPALFLTLLTTFLLTVCACPVKPGFLANGQFRDITGLTPLCTSTFRKLAAGVRSGEYGELYRTDLSAAGRAWVDRAVGLFTSYGWERGGVQTKGQDRVYTVRKAGKQTVIAVRIQTDSLLMLVVGRA